MPQKSKVTQQKAADITNAHASCHSFQISHSILIPDATMNDTTMPKTLQSLSLEIITNLVDEEIQGGIALEGPRDSLLGLEGSWDHCELNFIEFFWGTVKKCLWEHCDYTFKTLKTNLLKALESVQLSTIQKWEHQMIRWMEAYRNGKSTKNAQFDVKKFGSHKYISHHKAIESVT